MDEEKPITIEGPTSLSATFIGAGLTFLVSLPLMWLIGNYAAFTAYGLGLWIIPYLCSRVGLHFLASKGIPGYHDVVYIFAVVAAIQNAALVWWNQRSKSTSKVLHFVLLALLFLTVFGVALGLIVMVAL